MCHILLKTISVQQSDLLQYLLNLMVLFRFVYTKGTDYQGLTYVDLSHYNILWEIYSCILGRYLFPIILTSIVDLLTCILPVS